MIVGWVLFVVAVIVAGWLARELKERDTSYRSTKEHGTALAEQLSQVRRSLADAEKSAADVTSRLSEVQAEHKRAKEKLHQLTQEKKGGGAAKAVRAAESSSTRGEHEALLVARQDLAESRQEAEALRQRLASLEGELSAARAAAAKAQREQPLAAVAAAAAAPAADAGEHEQKRGELEAKLKSQRGEVARLRKDHEAEVAELKRRLSRALRDIDKQRGRAENNEKAYQIAMNEVHKAYDQLERFDPTVRRPFVALAEPPRPRGRRAAEGEAEAASPEAVEASSPAVEAAPAAEPVAAAGESSEGVVVGGAAAAIPAAALETGAPEAAPAKPARAPKRKEEKRDAAAPAAEGAPASETAPTAPAEPGAGEAPPLEAGEGTPDRQH